MANLATINDNILADSGIDPINLIVGTGTVNYIPKFTAEGSIGNSIMTESGANILISSNIVLHAGNYNNYAPTLTGGGASGTWGINISGNAATATNANNADTVDGLHASAFALTGGSNATGTWPISITGSASSATAASTANLVIGTSGGAIQSWDIRTIAPSNMTAGRLGFGFTSWANNNSAPYADYLHLRSYTDASGGNDNLVMFLKSGIGMRIYQQAWGSSAPYVTYVDVLDSGNFNAWAPTLTGGGASGTWGISITGNADTLDGYHASDFALASSLSNYLPLAGGTMTGSLSFADNPDNVRIQKGSNHLNLRDPWNNFHLAIYSGGSVYTDSAAYYFRSAAAALWMSIENGNVSAFSSMSAPIFYDSQNTGYYLDPASTSNLYRASFNAINIGDYSQYSFSLPYPGANYGNGRIYMRIQPVQARLVSFQMKISSTWNWAPAFGYICADVSYYCDGTTIHYAQVTITSATGQALANLAIGDLVIENGYISVPVYSTNSNGISVKIEGSPSFDYSLVSYSSWDNVAFPGSNTVNIPGNFNISGTGTMGGNTLATQSWVQSNYVPTSRTLTINGVTYDLSANRSWTVSSGVNSILAGEGISVDQNQGDVTISNTGVLSVNGSTGDIIGIATTAQLANYLPLAGGTMSGSIAMGGNNITNVSQLAHANGRIILTGNLHIDSFNGNAIYLQYYNQGVTTRIYGDIDMNNYNTTNVNIGYANNSFRAPIFYDSNDTNYYLDPNGTSNIYKLSFANSDATNHRNEIIVAELPTWGTGKAFFDDVATYGVDGYGLIIQVGYADGGDVGGMKITDDGIIMWGAGDEDLFRLYNEDSSVLALRITDSNVAYFSTNIYMGGELVATQPWVQSNYVPTSRTLTINGVTYDLSANRSWTIAAGVTSILAGAGISVDQNQGDVTISNTGVLSVNGSTGDITGIATTAQLANYLPLAGGTMSGTILFANNIGTALQGTMGDNDFWRIYAQGSSNAGYLEIATADDGTEPIYFSQYTGVFNTLVRRLILLDGNGNTLFPGFAESSASFRAPLFYDSTNTAYYVAPSGTSNLLTATILNTYVGNAIYFGGGNNYLNWDGARISSNRGIQSDTDMRAPIFYDSNDTAFYGNFAGNSRFNTTQINSIADQSYARLVSPEGGVSVNNSPLTAAIKIKIPPAASYQNTMLSFTVKIYNYQTGTSRTIYIGGYTYYNQDWYNIFAYQVGDVGGDLAVRFGKDGTGNCVWIGETSTYWSYPNVFVTDVQSGHSQPTTMATNWSISFVTSFDTVQDSRVAYYQINAGNIASQSVSYASSAGNADTLDGYHASYFVPTARTLTINGVTYDLSANRSWTVSSGVNSIIAGEGIAVDQAQGDVTISNTGVLSVNGSTGDITGIATTAQLAGYLPLAGGTTSGTITASFDNSWGFRLNRSAVNTYIGVVHATNGTNNWFVGQREDGTNHYRVYNFQTTINALSVETSGDVYAYSSFRAPIFYDSNDTSYYGNFAGVSRLSGLGVGESYYNHTYPGIIQSGSTSYNYDWYNGSWSSSVTVGYLANCSDVWEFAVHDSGHRVASVFYFQGGGVNRILMGRDLGWGSTYIEAASSFRAPIFYDSADTSYYLDPNSTSNLYSVYAYAYRGNGNVDGTGSASYHPSGIYSTGNNWLYGTLYMAGNNMRSIGGIVQNDIMGRPNVQWGAGGSTTGAVIIKFPGNTGNYGMVHAVIDIYEYNGNNVSTVIVGGHNWGSQWYSYGANVVGYTNKQVRVGVKDGQYCIIIGDGSSTWSYGQVVLRKIQNGSYYSGVMDVGAGYTIGIESDDYSWVSGDLRTFRSSGNMYMNEALVATQSWVSSQGYVTGGPFLPLSGGTVTGTTNFSAGVNFAGQTNWFGGYGPGSGPGIALENLSTFARFAFWGLDFYDWNHGIQMTIDNGYVSAANSFRAPIFYDSNDTNYYLDPNSFSNLGTVRVQSLNSPNGDSVVAADSAMPAYQSSFIHTLAIGPGGNDGHILGMTWTNTSIYGAQIFLDTDPNDIMAIRSRSNAGVWTSWKTVLHSGNYSSYALPLSGGTMTGQIYGPSINTGVYGGLIQVREEGYVTTSQSGWGWAPAITFHWGGRAAIKFGLRADGFMAVDDQKLVIENGGSWNINAASATYLNSSNYIVQRGAQGTWNDDFQATPAGTMSYGGDLGASTTNGPGGTWWMQQNFRHTNSSNYWGVQVAWGWEDNRARLATRNVQGGNYDSWVYYLNSSNYNDYTVTKTGGGASGTWGINITGNAATATSAGGVDFNNITAKTGGTGTYQTSGDFRAPIYYDSADTSYYLDPNSSSRLYRVNSYYFANPADVSDDHPFGLYFGSGLSTAYAIYRNGGAWTHPYPDLRIAFHTGIQIGANASYQGVRFYTDYDMGTQVMSVNNSSDPLGGGNVYVNNSLQAGSSLRAPIFYDSDNTSYYGDFAGTSVMNIIQPNHINRLSTDYSSVALNGISLRGYSSGSMWVIGNTGTTELLISQDWNWDTQIAINYQVVSVATPTSTLRIGQLTKNSATWTHGTTELWTNGAARMTIGNTGATTFSSSVTATGFFESSDARLKTVVDENYRVDAIVAIKPKFYQKNGKFEVGYIAQEVEGVFEHAVVLGLDGYLNLSYTQVHTLKIAALEDSVDDIKKKIKELEEKLNTLY